MKKQATTRKKKHKYNKGNQQYKEKKKKPHYADNDSLMGANRVQAENRRGRWRWKLIVMETREETRQWMVGSEADVEEIDNAHKTN